MYTRYPDTTTTFYKFGKSNSRIANSETPNEKVKDIVEQIVNNKYLVS
jgi:hypothetical protein